MSEYQGGRGGRIGRGGNHRPIAQAQRREAGYGGSGVRPVWFIVIMDVLVLGLALNIYGYSLRAFRPTVTPKKLPVASPIATAKPSPTPSTASTSPTESQTSQEATPQPTQEVAADQGMWGAKFADKFATGDTEKTPNSYKSKDVNVVINKVSENNLNYYVTDIYIRNLQNFKTAFSHDKFPNSIDSVVNQARDRNAVLAINGDDAGYTNQNGYIVRNGEEYRTKPYQDVLVLYQDGSMKAYSKNDFNYEQAKQDGIWQVWSFGPMLLDDNSQPKTSFDTDVPNANPRSVVGYYEPGHYCLVLVESAQKGQRGGLNMTDLSQLMYKLGCKAAYNLDGGQSSVLAFNGEVYSQPYTGGRRVGDIIYIGEAE